MHLQLRLRDSKSKEQEKELARLRTETDNTRLTLKSFVAGFMINVHASYLCFLLVLLRVINSTGYLLYFIPLLSHCIFTTFH
jgi:hypothetical protein